MHDLFIAVGFGLVTASILALSAVALSLQLSVTSVPNFAHGELLTIGAYGALVASHFTPNFYAQGISAAVAGAALAWVLNTALLVPFVRAGAKRLTLFVVTIGASLVIQNALVLFFGGAYVTSLVPTSNLLSIGPFLFTATDLGVMGVAVAIMLALHVVLKYTKFGKAQRAVADSPELARVSGIVAPRIVTLTWLLAGAIAGLGGFVLGTTVGSFAPGLGNAFLFVTFAAAVVGGLGKPYGAMAGALLIGILMEVSALYIDAAYKQVVAFAVLILFLLLKPNGIFGPIRAIVGE
jgi:branched-subunit amino acid ABC-type transport system permease component